ncbi:MAG: hypothetical protein LUH42_08415 [Oscillospiraceae bacterium]|nr:hypothetical protein [Oscillospiraceae bacterium]
MNVIDRAGTAIHSLVGLGLGFIIISIFIRHRRTYRRRKKRLLFGRRRTS